MTACWVPSYCIIVGLCKWPHLPSCWLDNDSVLGPQSLYHCGSVQMTSLAILLARWWLGAGSPVTVSLWVCAVCHLVTPVVHFFSLLSDCWLFHLYFIPFLPSDFCLTSLSPTFVYITVFPFILLCSFCNWVFDHQKEVNIFGEVNVFNICILLTGSVLVLPTFYLFWGGPVQFTGL